MALTTKPMITATMTTATMMMAPSTDRIPAINATTSRHEDAQRL
jgi:hypothetical protein